MNNITLVTDILINLYKSRFPNTHEDELKSNYLRILTGDGLVFELDINSDNEYIYRKFMSCLTALGFVYFKRNTVESSLNLILPSINNYINFGNLSITEIENLLSSNEDEVTLQNFWFNEAPKLTQRIFNVIDTVELDDYSPKINYINDLSLIINENDLIIIKNCALAFSVDSTGNIIILKSRFEMLRDIELITSALAHDNPYSEYHLIEFNKGMDYIQLLDDIKKANGNNKTTLLYYELTV